MHQVTLLSAEKTNCMFVRCNVETSSPVRIQLTVAAVDMPNLKSVGMNEGKGKQSLGRWLEYVQGKGYLE